MFFKKLTIIPSGYICIVQGPAALSVQYHREMLEYWTPTQTA